MLLGLSALFGLSPRASAKLNVVVTTADLAALVREVGDDQVTLTMLAKPTEDPHFVDPKPSFIAKLNRADALVEGGAELEVGWLPPLLENARNSKLASGAPGRIDAAEGIKLLEAPATLDRSRGDVHAMGNPHFLIDPVNARIVAAHLAEAFCKLDSANASGFRANLARFEKNLDEKLRQWQSALKPFEGARLVAYHNMWPYFGERFGLHIDLFLEPKPGIPPTPSHLSEVIGQMKQEKIKIIIIEPYQHRRTAESVAQATGATILPLTQYPGGLKGTEAGYIAMLDYTVNALAKALAAAGQ
jgi:zinc/manganese transport system substrate-binding protein